jgi:hypothetical protein
MSKRRPLERLLLDGDITSDLEDHLRLVGFQVESARELVTPQILQKDHLLVRWARQHRYILVCHDKHKQRKVNLFVYQEIYDRGGTILRITGDSSQDTLTALGKVTVHREEWSPFLAREHGIAVVGRDGCKLFTRHKLIVRVQGMMKFAEEPMEALRQIQPGRSGRKRPRTDRRPSKNQMGLTMDSK